MTRREGRPGRRGRLHGEVKDQIRGETKRSSDFYGEGSLLKCLRRVDAPDCNKDDLDAFDSVLWLKYNHIESFSRCKRPKFHPPKIVNLVPSKHYICARRIINMCADDHIDNRDRQSPSRDMDRIYTENEQNIHILMRFEFTINYYMLCV